MNDVVWKTVQFGDLAADTRNAIVGGPFGSNLVSGDYTDAGVPVIRGQNMGEGRWVSGPFAFVSEEKAESLRANLARPGDIVFTQRGTLGQVALVPDAPWDRYVVSQSQMKATVNPDLADPLFVYYYFTNPAEQHYIIANAIQTGVPHSNLGQLRAHPMRVPSLCEQRAIADVLGALDDKIEQNRRTAQALERLARAIFRAWFVDFQPVKAKAAGATVFPSMPQPVFDALPTGFVDSKIGPVPEGWEVFQHRVAELEAQGALSVGDGYRAKRSELADSGFPFIRAGNVNGTVNTEGAELLCAESATKAGPKRSRVWDTVFTSKGTVGRIGLITPWTGDVVYAPQVCFWRSLDERTIDPFFLHLWICSDSFTHQWMAVKGNTDMADFVSLSDQRCKVPSARSLNRSFD